MPLNDTIIRKYWLDEWTTGSEHIDIGLQAALMDKAENFDAALHIPTLKKLVDNHCSAAPVAPTIAAKEALVVDEYNFMMKQLDYDVQVFETWEKKCSTVLGARYFKEQEFKLGLKKKCEAAAVHFANSCIKLVSWTSAAEAITECMNFKRQLHQKLGGSLEDILNIPLLNWVSPCMIPFNFQADQINVLTWALNDNLKSCAIALMPAFTYSKGKLHLEETKFISQLSKGNHNLDYQFSLNQN